MKRSGIFLILIFGLIRMGMCGTTGKISGYVTDAVSGQPMPGANIIIQGTIFGAASNEDGFYVIIHVPPGNFKLEANYIGYAPYSVSDVNVNIDLTTTINFPMRSAAIQTKEIMVIADKPIIKRDVAGSQLSISTQDIEVLPATSVQEVIGLKAGITSNLEVRGSGSDETVFMVDGIVQKDARTNQPVTGVPLSSVQEISVQSGGFSAEYNNVRAGVVNVVTKEGNPDYYSATVSFKASPPGNKHFNISPFDPESYWLWSYMNDNVCWTGTDGLNDYEIRNVNKFSGWNSVSQISLQNDDPDDDITAAAAKRIFEWEHRRDGTVTKWDYNVDMGVGGPVPMLKNSGNTRFFLSYRQDRNMYVIPQATDGKYDRSGLLKITTDISHSKKLSLTAFYSDLLATSTSRSGYSGYMETSTDVAYLVASGAQTVNSRIWTDNYWSQTRLYNNMFNAKYTQMINSGTYFEINAKIGSKRYRTGPGPDRDTSAIYEIFDAYFVDEAPVGFLDDFADGIDGMGMGGAFSTGRDSSEMISYSLKADFASQLNEHNQFKAGYEFIYDDLHMDFGSYVKPLPTGNYWTEFDRYPFRMNSYVQNKMEFEGMIATIGIIGEYINANGDWFDVTEYDAGFFSSNFKPGVTEVEIKKVAPQLYLSPRLGISHPISERAKLFFNYGHYIQMPASQNLYRIQRYEDNKVITMGNPALPLARTISYEVGFERSYLNSYLFRIAAYYKDITDQEDATGFYSTDGKVEYSLVTSNSYEDIRGIEIELAKMAGRWMTGTINYEYRVNSYGYFGIQRYYQNPADQREYEKTSPTQGTSLPRPRVKSYVDIHTPADFGPSLLSQKLIADWHCTLIGAWTAGSWFTWNPNYVAGQGGLAIQYNVRWKPYYNVDMKLSKTFSVNQRTSLKFFVDISNLMNKRHFYSGSFYDSFDRNYYLYSLHLSPDIADPLKYGNIPGSDQPGDYRKTGVDYQPMVYKSDIQFGVDMGTESVLYYNAADNDYYIFTDTGWMTADDNYVDQVLEEKAYIDMPNQTFFTFLDPRNIYIGINLSFDLK